MKLERFNKTITISSLSKEDLVIILNIIPKIITKYHYEIEQIDLAPKHLDFNYVNITLKENYSNLSEFSFELVKSMFILRETT